MATSSSFNLVPAGQPSVPSLRYPRPGLSAFHHVPLSWREKGRLSTRVMAMVGPKYKGTQMREMRLAEMIEEKVNEAKEVCGEDAASDGCKVAWDEVEEVSQAKAHLRRKLEVEKHDPLESFCQGNPETDECCIYED